MSDLPTPETDEASFSTVIQGELVRASFARRLERDRAALMEALEKVEATDQKLPAHVWRSVLSALSTARANFPTP